MTRSYVDGRVSVWPGSMLDVLPGYMSASFDACITDGPYFLPEIGMRLGAASAAPIKGGGVFARGSTRFLGKADIVGDICNKVETWREVHRVLKPGAYLVAFNCTKSYDLMTAAVRASGFEIVDMIPWHYATGFPRGRSIAAQIDKRLLGQWCDDDELARGPVSHMAAFYEGFSTSLKPATEAILIARKPTALTSGDNVMRHGVGGMNVGGCRVEHETGSSYPANMMHDGSSVVVEQFPLDAHGKSVSRFFWHPKADASDRDGSEHPTVKPIGLMRELVRLVTNVGHLILDPFAGSGTTGIAAIREGRRAVLIEKDPQYQRDLAARFEKILLGPDERRRAEAVASPPFEAGTLFAGMGN